MTPADLNEIGAYCPTCWAEYRPGFETCADDGTRLVPGAAPPREARPPEPVLAPQPEAPPRRWIRVATVAKEDEAVLLAGFLRSAGVDAVTDPDLPLGGYYGSEIQARLLQGIHVLVPEDQADAARASLAEVDRP